MSLEAWIGIATSSLVVSLFPYLWRTWRWSEERELKRIYIKAAMLGEGSFLAQVRRACRSVIGKSSRDDLIRELLVVGVKDKVFWREAVLKEKIDLIDEQVQLCRTLTKVADGRLSEELEAAVELFYEEVFDGLAGAKNPRWTKRADRELEHERMAAVYGQLVEKLQATRTFDEEGEPRVIEGADLRQLKEKPDELSALRKWALSYNTELALSIAYELSIFLDLQGKRKEARAVLDEALELILVRGQTAPVELQVRVLDRAANLANKQADCEQAEVFAEKILDLCRNEEPSIVTAAALQRLGRSRYFRCDSEVARELLEESLIQHQTLGNFKGVAWVQFDLGMLEVNLGDLTSAHAWLEKSLTWYLKDEKNGDKNGEGTVRVNLAVVLHQQHDWPAAWRQMNKAGDLLKGDVYLRRENYFRWYLHFLGRLNIDEGLLDTARQHFRESLEIFRDREDKLGIIRSLLGFSWLAAKEGSSGQALTLLGAEDGLRSKQMDNLPPPPDWKTEIDFVINTARTRLDDSAYKAAWIKGVAMTWEQAIKCALT